MKFEFYVINYDINRRCIERFNIFNNVLVQENVEKEVKKYLRSPKTYSFTTFCNELRNIIAWQERGRCEYEIVVGEWPYREGDFLTKIDCYYQAEKNIPMIAREVIYQYKAQKGKGKNNE